MLKFKCIFLQWIILAFDWNNLIEGRQLQTNSYAVTLEKYIFRYNETVSKIIHTVNCQVPEELHEYPGFVFKSCTAKIWVKGKTDTSKKNTNILPFSEKDDIPGTRNCSDFFRYSVEPGAKISEKLQFRCQVIYTEKDACEQDKPGTNCLRGKFRKTFPCPEPTNAYSVSGTCSTAVCNKTSDCRPECKHHRELFLTANPTEVPFNESNIIKKVLEIGVGFQSSVSICLDNFAGLVEFDDTFFVSLSDKLTWAEWLKKHSSISLIIVSSALGAVLLLFLYFLVRSISRKCKRSSKKSEMYHQEIEEPMADLPDENQRLEIRKIPQGRFAVTNEHDRMVAELECLAKQSANRRLAAQHYK